MRQFFLETGTGERLSLQSKSLFFYLPTGLGFSENRTLSQIEYGFWTEQNKLFGARNILGTMVFTNEEQDPYVSYEQFVNFIESAESLKLVYVPYTGRELYSDVKFNGIELSEKDVNGLLQCETQFVALSPYYEKNPLNFYFSTNDITTPFVFPFTYPFQYVDGNFGGGQTFTVDGHFDAAFELKIYGAASNISFYCTDLKGNEIGRLELPDVSIEDGEYILYSTKPNQDGIWLVSNGTKEDLVPYLDINLQNFFLLPKNKTINAYLKLTAGAGTEKTHVLSVFEYFKG